MMAATWRPRPFRPASAMRTPGRQRSRRRSGLDRRAAVLVADTTTVARGAPCRRTTGSACWPTVTSGVTRPAPDRDT